MSISTLLHIYVAAAIALLAWAAYLDRHSAREALLVAVLWPFLVPLLILDEAIKRSGWRIDVQPRGDLSFFGWRRPTPPAVGRALRVFWIELQVWKRAA